MPYSIMLDAGHGGRDPGAVYNGRQEKDDTLALTLAVGEILQNNGIDVEYTRTTDVYETPFEKAMEANNAGVDFFVSIHRNSFPTDNEVSGVETLVYDLSGLKYQVAQAIARGILDGLSAGGALEGGEAPEYRIQTGLFRNWTYARRMENELLEEGFPAFVDDTGQYLSVQVGPYQTLVQAAEEEQKLRSAGYQTLIIR